MRGNSNHLEKVIKPATGTKYHVSWASPGCVWVCIEVRMNSGWVKLKTPRTGKETWAKIESLRHIRKNQGKWK